MPYSHKFIAIVCNPLSGRNNKSVKIADLIVLQLKELNIRHSVFVTQWPMAWNDVTEVWIIGGDGTINWFVNQYPEIKLPLAVFAGGTGNDFHWMLYSHLTIEEQVMQVLKGNIKAVDAGRCNGKLFLNGVGIGFDGAVVRDLIGRKKAAGKITYMLSVMKQIIGYREKKCSLQIDGENISQHCFMVSIANGQRYGGGFRVAPEASVTDGLLELIIIGKVPSLKRMFYLPRIEKGKHLGLSFVRFERTHKFEMSSTIPLHAHLDGEYLHSTHFQVEILPEYFSFLC